MVSRGNVLIVLLWIMAVLGFLALSISSEVKRLADLSYGVSKRRSFFLLAFSAFEESLVRMVLEDDSRRWLPDGSERELELWGKKLNVVLEDESQKLNVNTAKEEDLAAVLASLGVQEPDALAQAILDFCDWDNAPRPLGAEDDYYLSLTPPYKPLNRPFRRFEELLLVRGMTPELWWRLLPHITLWGGGDTPFGPLTTEATGLVPGKNYRVTVKGDGFSLIAVVQYTATGDMFQIRQLCEHEDPKAYSS